MRAERCDVSLPMGFCGRGMYLTAARTDRTMHSVTDDPASLAASLLAPYQIHGHYQPALEAFVIDTVWLTAAHSP